MVSVGQLVAYQKAIYRGTWTNLGKRAYLTFLYIKVSYVESQLVILCKNNKNKNKKGFFLQYLRKRKPKTKNINKRSRSSIKSTQT